MFDTHPLSTWIFVLIVGTSDMISATPHAQPTAAGAGIWKAAVPRTPMQGEFENLDPLGVAAGARIKADCSLNWINPNDGKRYCFSSGTSLEFFLDQPQTYLERARVGWRKMNRHVRRK